MSKLFKINYVYSRNIELCFSYLLFVTDVLTSVQKTEESLRRLKKIRDKSTGVLPSEPQGISDDEKIRIQLKVDVDGYTDMVKKYYVHFKYTKVTP